MKILLSTKTVFGTDKGGEDLFLEVKVTSEVEPALYSTVSFDEAWRRCLSMLARSQAEADARQEDLWADSETGHLVSYETEYSFKVNLHLDEVRQKARDTVFDGDWVLHLKTKQYEVVRDVFIGGNAD